MKKYITYRYVYPPRPKNAISPCDLDFWDNGSLLAQPKINGSNCVIFTNGIIHSSTEDKNMFLCLNRIDHALLFLKSIKI